MEEVTANPVAAETSPAMDEEAEERDILHNIRKNNGKFKDLPASDNIMDEDNHVTVHKAKLDRILKATKELTEDIMVFDGEKMSEDELARINKSLRKIADVRDDLYNGYMLAKNSWEKLAEYRLKAMGMDDEDSMMGIRKATRDQEEAKVRMKRNLPLKLTKEEEEVVANKKAKTVQEEEEEEEAAAAPSAAANKEEDKEDDEE
jgi:hypothetical protein